MKKVWLYFNYIIFSLIAGVIVIVLANNSGFLPKKFDTIGTLIQSTIYGLGYGIICFGFLKQKDEWFLINEYPFKKQLLRFKYFKKKDEIYNKRKNK